MAALKRSACINYKDNLFPLFGFVYPAYDLLF